MSDSIDISVIIPMYNAEALIERCLDSIRRQTGKFNAEIIVIDDGSTDNSVEIVRRRQREDNIIMLQQRHNHGPACARNKGIEQAHGKYLTFLDADDYWLPDFFKITGGFLDNHPKCIAVSVAQKHLTTMGTHECPNSWKTLAVKEGIELEDFFSFWANHNHICTGSIMIRSEIAKLTRGQREELRIAEDLEYWAYLSTFGKIGYIPELLFVSDGLKVTENIGWVAKHLPRWESAVTIEDWQKRIVEKLNSEQQKNFSKIRGYIGRNLVYSILMSKRYQLARTQIKVYGKEFPKDLMTRILRFGASNSLFWFIVSQTLIWREYHR